MDTPVSSRTSSVTELGRTLRSGNWARCLLKGPRRPKLLLPHRQQDLLSWDHALYMLQAQSITEPTTCLTVVKHVVLFSVCFIVWTYCRSTGLKSSSSGSSKPTAGS
ncbi:hypothetical protein GOODEAATRI_015024 [Goodea atripinnis]|uniref:Uncharacterized protein n=1 Tax=Goodea atripinnis TaxID=208336 RepID=A0ABV0MHV4_9TELE